jgi:hypothetical protein
MINMYSIVFIFSNLQILLDIVIFVYPTIQKICIKILHACSLHR